MYINQKWTVVKGNDIKNKAKIASVVFEERKMQNKCNSIHHRRNMCLVVTMAGRENRDAVCLSVYGRVTERCRGPPISAHVYCGQMAGWIGIPLGTEVCLGPGDIMLAEDPAPQGKWHSSHPHFVAHVYCGQTVAHLSKCRALV